MPAAVEPCLVSPPPTGIVRVGYRPDPFLWREPKRLEDEDQHGPYLAGNRFDAPDCEYRTLYFASVPYGAWLEKLSRFRPIAGLAAMIDAALDEDPDPEHDQPLPDGSLPADFFAPLVIGEAQLDVAVRFIDVAHEHTLAALSHHIGRAFLDRYGLKRFDTGVPAHQDRNITRALALELYRLAERDPAIVGLRYSSTHAGGVDCWALWEKGATAMHTHSLAPVDLTNPALRDAATVLHVTLPDPPPTTPLPPDMPEPW
jgi:hypothetical protein